MLAMAMPSHDDFTASNGWLQCQVWRGSRGARRRRHWVDTASAGADWGVSASRHLHCRWDQTLLQRPASAVNGCAWRSPHRHQDTVSAGADCGVSASRHLHRGSDRTLLPLPASAVDGCAWRSPQRHQDVEGVCDRAACLLCDRREIEGGKFAMPLCFKGIDTAALPVTYRKAWMMGVFFKEWLDKLNEAAGTERPAVHWQLCRTSRWCFCHPTRHLAYSPVMLESLLPWKLITESAWCDMCFRKWMTPRQAPNSASVWTSWTRYDGCIWLRRVSRTQLSRSALPNVVLAWVMEEMETQRRSCRCSSQKDPLAAVLGWFCVNGWCHQYHMMTGSLPSLLRQEGMCQCQPMTPAVMRMCRLRIYPAPCSPTRRRLDTWTNW